EINGKLELVLADLGAVRAAERRILEIFGGPAGALGAGAGRKMRRGRPLSGLRCSHDLPFQIVSLPLGGGVPAPPLRESPDVVKMLRKAHARLIIPAELPAVWRHRADAGKSWTQRPRSRSRRRRTAHRSSFRCS